MLIALTFLIVLVHTLSAKLYREKSPWQQRRIYFVLTLAMVSIEFICGYLLYQKFMHHG